MSHASPKLLAFHTVTREDTVLVIAESQERRDALLHEHLTRHPPPPCSVIQFPARP